MRVNCVCVQRCFIWIVMLTVNALDRVITAPRASISPSIFYSYVLVSLLSTACYLLSFDSYPSPIHPQLNPFSLLHANLLRGHSEPKQHTLKLSFLLLTSYVLTQLCPLSVFYCVKFLHWEWAFQQQLWELYIIVHARLEGCIHRLHTCACLCAHVCV